MCVYVTFSNIKIPQYSSSYAIIIPATEAIDSKIWVANITKTNLRSVVHFHVYTMIRTSEIHKPLALSEIT